MQNHTDKPWFHVYYVAQRAPPEAVNALAAEWETEAAELGCTPTTLPSGYDPKILAAARAAHAFIALPHAHWRKVHTKKARQTGYVFYLSLCLLSVLAISSLISQAPDPLVTLSAVVGALCIIILQIVAYKRLAPKRSADEAEQAVQDRLLGDLVHRLRDSRDHGDA